MRREASSLNPIIAVIFLVLLSVFTLTNHLYAQGIHSNNDAGVTATNPVLSINPNSVLITQTFDDGTLPKPSNILSTSSGSQTGRLYRDGFPSTCDSTSAFMTYGSDNIKYETFAFKAATTGCVNLTATFSGGVDYGLYCAIYSNSYDPTNYVSNGVGQAGYSGDISFSCPVVKGQTYVLVIMEVSENSGTGDTYTISLDNVQAVPVSIWWILAAFILIGSFTIFKLRFKKAIV